MTASDRTQTLERLFHELASRWLDAAPTRQVVTDERLRRELALPRDAPSRICFFSIPRLLLPQYRESIFPLAESAGYVPTAGDDAVSPGGNLVSVMASLLERAELLVADLTREDQRVRNDLLSVSRRSRQPHIALIVDEPDPQLPPFARERIRLIRRRDAITADIDATPGWVTELDEWLSSTGVETQLAVEDEPTRLLELGMYRAAVIAAISGLEVALGRALDDFDVSIRSYDKSKRGTRNAPVGVLIDAAATNGIISPDDAVALHEIRRLRDRLVHTDAGVDGRTARPMVERVIRLTRQLPLGGARTVWPQE